MFTRLLYSNRNNPSKNIEVRRYKCGHYHIRGFITTYGGKYVFRVSSFHRTRKGNLLVLLSDYDCYFSEVIEWNTLNPNVDNLTFLIWQLTYYMVS